MALVRYGLVESRTMSRIVGVALALALGSGAARAAQPPAGGGVAPANVRYALFRLDPLGLSAEIVEQLESILRVELGRAVGGGLPPRVAIDQLIAKFPKLAGCTSDPVCLQPLARELAVQRVVAGTVAGLADSYIVNLKLADEKGKELGRVTANLHGNPDELIQEVRVAAYKLVAPHKLTGSISLLSEVPGASVQVDGKSVGVTPLSGPVNDLAIGEHELRVSRVGYAEFVDKVPVRFEKATEVVVHQKAVTLAARLEEAERKDLLAVEPPFYARWWFWAGSAAVAIGLGILVGGVLGSVTSQTVAR
jgi:hypothetical protein